MSNPDLKRYAELYMTYHNYLEFGPDEDEKVEFEKLEKKLNEDLEKVKKLEKWYQEIKEESEHKFADNHKFLPSAIRFYLEQILGVKND